MTELGEGSNTTTRQFDQGRGEAFAERPADAPNGGATARARGGQAEPTTSKDGAQIAYRRSGEGPPLVLVHGAAADPRPVGPGPPGA